MATCFDLVIAQWSARFAGRVFPVAIGRSGIGEKCGEGDGITPHGVFHITQILVRADRVLTRGLPISSTMGWSDDPEDPAYNTLINRHLSPFSHERMHRADTLYNLVGVLDFNDPPVAGKGSAIFLHCWRGPRRPTEGCVAFAPQTLAFILQNWSPRSRVIIR